MISHSDTWIITPIILLLVSTTRGSIFLEGLDDWQNWPIKQLEHEVASAEWNPSKTPDEVIKDYVDGAIGKTVNAQTNVPNERDIKYGPKHTQRYDEYGMNFPSTAPIYIWIHGGTWTDGSKDIAGYLAETLYQKGIRNIVLGYTLAPAATLKQMEEEVALALKAIHERFPHANITVAGHSAGAHLAAMLLHNSMNSTTVSTNIVEIQLFSGFYDLRPFVRTKLNDDLHLTWQTADASSPLRVQKIKSHFTNRASSFRIFIACGNRDSNLVQKQSQLYYNLLRRTFPKTNFWKSESDDHFTILENLSSASTPTGAKFQERLQTLSTPPDSPQDLTEVVSDAQNHASRFANAITILLPICCLCNYVFRMMY